MQNNKLARYTHKKYEVYINTVSCIDFSQENSMHILQHQYIHYRKLSLKIGLHSPETPKVGCK